MQIFLLIIGVLLFIGLIVIHEFGHFIAARRNGVVAEEFGIGFPPQAWKRKIKSKRGDFIFSLNWLPLGGFVRLKGEHDSDTEKGTFGAATTWAKTKIMAAGIFMNLVTAVVLFTITALVGMPKALCTGQFTVASDTKVLSVPKNENVVNIADVKDGSPAAKAGIKPNSQLVSIAGTPIKCGETVAGIVKANAGSSLPVTTLHDGKTETHNVILPAKDAHLGIGMSSAQEGMRIQRSTWSAPIVAVGVTWDFTVATYHALGSAVHGLGSTIAGALTGNKAARQTGQEAATREVSGPVGVYAILKAGASQGIGFILFVIAVLSLSLAIINVLPIPALDGGKLAITYISRLFGKQVSETFENYAYGISFVLLIGLMVLITIVDVKRFF